MLNDINKKIIEAKKARDKFTANSFNLLKSELLNNQKVEKPKAELEVVKSYVKKLSKSLPSFEGTERHAELVKEYDLVKTLLPEEMSVDAIRVAVKDYLSQNPEVNHMGKAIGALKGQLENAEGALLAKVVKEEFK
ncbi:GatB/YqeY domain-containing protein [bacterium]|nr:GatB/YqeY domain-containing protein [bacterium]